jgi:imidazolonepropionase
MATLIKNIKALAGIYPDSVEKVSGSDMAIFPQIENAWLLIEDDKIAAFGQMENCLPRADSEMDVAGKFVFPAYCDSHTHLVYAGTRDGEFIDKVRGLSYEEIAQKGGGILNSALKLNQTSEDELFEQSMVRIEEVMKTGTGAIELKSGYGLSVAGELKMLRVIQRIKESAPLIVKATFLGAHALPAEFKSDKKGYLDLLIKELLPQIAAENLADFIDVFCETGYFDRNDTLRIIEAGEKYGLKAKIHVNQFTSIGGIPIAVHKNALSVDHLEEMEESDFEALINGNTIPVTLPGCSFFINIPYTPARRIIDMGLPIAIASDFNPGSAPSGNMNFLLSLASIKMNLLPEEAFNATTLNGAYAMGLEQSAGSITVGKKANLIITKTIPSLHYIPYSFAMDQVWKTILNGMEV